jgi:nucleoside-diphosphate-sugar epimerase
MSENRIGSLDTPYAITKLLGEQYCRYFFENYGLKVNSLRLFNAFGPGEMPGKYRNVVPNFLWLAMNGKPLPIVGDGLQTRSFTYVEDTVDAIIRSSVREEAINEAINVGSDVETPIIELAELINEVTGNKAGIEFKQRPNWDSVLRRHPNLEKAKSLLNWAPNTSLRNGIDRYYLWLKTAVSFPHFGLKSY